MHFNGPFYDPEYDRDRLSRQHFIIRELMLDGRWRTLAEIAEITGYLESTIINELKNLKKASFGGHVVDKRRRGSLKRGEIEYSLIYNDEGEF